MSTLLLEAYDYLRAEHEKFNDGLRITLNEHPEGKRTQDQIKRDWHSLGDEWDYVVEEARKRFGSDVIDDVLAHMRVVHIDRETREKPLWKPGDPGPNPFGTST